MYYTIPRITHIDDISSCPVLPIQNFHWRCTQYPRAFGCLAVLNHEAFVIRLSCAESSPRKTYTEHFSPVYKDSALEVFFQFDTDSGIYINFEFNANGAVLAMSGHQRDDRYRMDSASIEALNIKAEESEDGWSITFILPLFVIQKVIPGFSLKSGQTFKFNFYKISESHDIEHYASLTEIHSDTPDFHRPCDFADAVIA